LVEDEGLLGEEPVTGDNMMIVMILIIISPKTDTVSLYVKEESRCL